MKKEDFKTYLIDYNYGGARWCLKVTATSPQDAMARVKQVVHYGVVAGELMAEIPAAAGAGLLTRAICWLKNLR